MSFTTIYGLNILPKLYTPTISFNEANSNLTIQDNNGYFSNYKIYIKYFNNAQELIEQDVWGPYSNIDDRFQQLSPKTLSMVSMINNAYSINASYVEINVGCIGTYFQPSDLSNTEVWQVPEN